LKCELRHLRVVGEGHDILRVGGAQLEGMCVLVGLFARREALQTGLVLEVFEVGVVRGHAARCQVLDHPRVGQRVEVAAQQQLDTVGVGLVARPEVLARLVQDGSQLVRQHHRLDQFDVAELRVPVDVRRAHQQRLVHLQWVSWQSCKSNLHI